MKKTSAGIRLMRGSRRQIALTLRAKRLTVMKTGRTVKEVKVTMQRARKTRPRADGVHKNL